jgi:hypothetical protein
MDPQRGYYLDVNAEKRYEDGWNGDEPGCCQSAFLFFARQTRLIE